MKNKIQFDCHNKSDKKWSTKLNNRQQNAKLSIESKYVNEKGKIKHCTSAVRVQTCFFSLLCMFSWLFFFIFLLHKQHIDSSTIYAYISKKIYTPTNTYRRLCVFVIVFAYMWNIWTKKTFSDIVCCTCVDLGNPSWFSDRSHTNVLTSHMNSIDSRSLHKNIFFSLIWHVFFFSLLVVLEKKIFERKKIIRTT